MEEMKFDAILNTLEVIQALKKSSDKIFDVI